MSTNNQFIFNNVLPEVLYDKKFINFVLSDRSMSSNYKIEKITHLKHFDYIKVINENGNSRKIRDEFKEDVLNGGLFNGVAHKLQVAKEFSGNQNTEVTLNIADTWEIKVKIESYKKSTENGGKVIRIIKDTLISESEEVALTKYVKITIRYLKH